MDNEQALAEAALDGLAGEKNYCLVCLDKPSYYAFTELGPDGCRLKVCSGCITAISNKWSVRQSIVIKGFLAAIKSGSVFDHGSAHSFGYDG